MLIQVQYLSDYEIERDTKLLLADYEETAGEPVKLPIPVAEITTYHLALRLGFADLHETLGIPMLRDQPDILGAIWIDEEAVLIDQSLDPKTNPSMKGRYRFSVAHEIGHWRLHRSYMAIDADEASFFDTPSHPTVICRLSQAKNREELQADRYASCLLMPKILVIAAWRDRFGSTKPRCLDVGSRISLFADIDKFPRPKNLVHRQPPSEMEDPDECLLDLDEMCVAQRVVKAASDDAALHEFVRPFAKTFEVSMVAMRIRLEKLGLLLRELPRQQSMVIDT